MMTSLNDEARNSVLDTLETLRQWSNEINATNDRYLTKALDRIAAAERAMGWPDHVSTNGPGPWRAKCTISNFSLPCATTC
jgi:hypothetical protein